LPDLAPLSDAQRRRLSGAEEQGKLFHGSTWSRPGVVRFLVQAISAILKPKALLVAESLCLRQQLLVLQHCTKCRKLFDITLVSVCASKGRSLPLRCFYHLLDTNIGERKACEMRS
jgi:hypothetical protein